MKLFNHSKLIIILVGSILILNLTSFSEVTSKSYDDLLRSTIQQSHSVFFLRPLPEDPRPSMISNSGLPNSSYDVNVDILFEKKAIPFLLDVINNGPGWSVDLSSSYSVLIPHLARCYAALCLGFTKDSQAYSILTDLLQNGKYLVDSNLSQEDKQRYDIKKYAIWGLGYLRDERAIDLLISNLENPNKGIALECAYALAKMDNMRVIEPILDAGEKNKIDGYVVGECLTAVTKLKLRTKRNRQDPNNIIVTYVDFPEMGEFKSTENHITKIWKNWLKNGKNWTKQKFEKNYNDYSEVKRNRPDEKSAANYVQNRILELGVAALPLIIEEIEKGDDSFIPVVAQITNFTIKNDSEAKDVLDWWKANKDKWTIFDYSDSQGN